MPTLRQLPSSARELVDRIGTSANLTVLPSRLALRPDQTKLLDADPREEIDTAVETVPRLFRQVSGDIEEVPDLGGTTFAELLGRGDVRNSTVFRAGQLRAAELESHLEAAAGANDMVHALPGGGWGVIGPDTRLLLQELHRARVSVAQRRRRRIAYAAGFLSLAVLAFNFWCLITVITGIVLYDGGGRGKMRWISFAVYLSSMPLVLTVIGFLRTRRPSTLGMVAFHSSAFVAVLHISSAIVSLILVFVWKKQVSRSMHGWGIDVSRSSLDADLDDALAEGGKTMRGWVVAGAARICLVVLVSIVWIRTIWMYDRAIRTPFVISPHALPSPELHSLLARHRAVVIPLPDMAEAKKRQPLHTADWLPSHLDRSQAYHVSEVSAAYSYVSSSASVFTPAEATSGSGGIATWLQAQLWRGVGWIIGITPFEGNDKVEDRLREEGPRKDVPQTSSEGVRDHDARTEFVSQESRERLADADRSDPGFDRASFDIVAAGSTGHKAEEEEPIRLSSAESRFVPTNTTTSPVLECLLPDHEPAFDVLPSLSAKDAPVYGFDSRAESSGSRRGDIVYVRMTDGKLVRRLSTIVSCDLGSEVEAGHARHDTGAGAEAGW
ncbi:hypothetical protein JCM3766R1_002540 [Sporobolomyces carnicolor]